ncbi:LpqB family beta-propeller domain-containing protein [Nocardioides sp. C4-1]|uniref:LpqB family beta-propeller domain-containing protein n=1 Tax=Nocardioides sp. C4-1 TaxID=3151851 RepID=UPI0032673C3E
MSPVVRALLAALALALTLGGCAGVPTSGPVVAAGSESTIADDTANDVNPDPPSRGMTESQVVEGFLDAMMASPIDFDVARQYLTTAAADRWRPEQEMITYDQVDTVEDSRRVLVTLDDAQRLSSTGAWLGRLRETEQTIELRLVYDDGNYRITNPPDAHLVPVNWFTQRYRQASLYFFDPTGSILVPQPVFVPEGTTLGRSLIDGLVAGPGPGLATVVRSYLPVGVTADVRVVGSVALVDLEASATVTPGYSTPTTQRMLAQLAETLGEDPTIRSLRVTLAGTPIITADGSAEYAVGAAAGVGPNGADPDTGLYAVRDGVLARRDGRELVPVAGAFGSGRTRVGLAAVDLSGSRAAGVGLRGRNLLLADLADPADGTEATATQVLQGERLLKPEWDFAERLWVVDRTRSGAVVRVVRGRQVREVDVPGVSGQDVRSFLVSRDGTRFLAVVASGDGDTVRVGRVESDPEGAVVSVRATEVLVPATSGQAIDDIAWASPTSVTLLSTVDPSFSEVRTIGVDGASGTEDDVRPVAGPLLGLVGSPLPDLPTYGITSTGLLDLVDYDPVDFAGGPPQAVDYAG